MKFDLELSNLLAQKQPDAVQSVDANDSMPYVLVRAEKLAELVAYLRDSEPFRMDYLNSIAAVHINESVAEGLLISKGFEVIYHLSSLQQNKAVAIKVFVEDKHPAIPTIDHLYLCANWFEREVFDLHGVTFTGSKNLRRIMLPDDWVGHPLRKDYVQASSYNGMSTSRPDELANCRVV